MKSFANGRLGHRWVKALPETWERRNPKLGGAMSKIDLVPASKNLSSLIEYVRDNALGEPTPCSEYCVGDLLDHIAGLAVAFGGAARKAEGESANMGPQGGASNLDADWRGSIPQRLEGLAQAWVSPSAWEGLTCVGGQELPGEIAGIILFGELVVHGWDLARGLDVSFKPDAAGVPSLFAVVKETFGPGQDAARGAAFGAAVPVSSDAPVFDQILGLLGRDPSWQPIQAAS
jgi:uncharacterized protein (TIGR03086 family)